MFIQGDDNANLLEGGGRDDTIDGLGGDDTLRGGGGADSLFGGLDDDILEGGALNDGLFGGSGADLLRGGRGDDTADGENGDDVLIGADGADSLFGGPGADLVLGGAGDDQLAGGLGADMVRGGAGADQIGASGPSTVLGGVGDDFIGGNGRGLELSGGKGQDRISLFDASRSVARGGAGDDVLEAQLEAKARADLLLNGGGGYDRFELFLRDATGRSFDFRGLSEGDIQVRGYGVVLRHLEAGDIRLDSAPAVIRIGDEAINLHTEGGKLIGGDAGTLFETGSGSDTIVAGGGDDTIVAGRGDDVVRGGRGVDTFRLSESSDAVQVDLNLDGQQFTGEGFDVLDSIENVIGGFDRDRLIGNLEANRLEDVRGDISGDEADTLIGGGGDDVLVVVLGGESDSLTGGAGADTFAFSDQVFSYDGDPDVVTDLSGEDWIDLSALDADVFTEGDQGFVVVSQFSGSAGEAVFEYNADGDFTLLLLDVTGSGRADAAIQLEGDHQAFDNFVL